MYKHINLLAKHKSRDQVDLLMSSCMFAHVYSSIVISVSCKYVAIIMMVRLCIDETETSINHKKTIYMYYDIVVSVSWDNDVT